MAKRATREAYGEALKEFAEKYDFVVLDADPFLCDPSELQHISVLRTYLGGKSVYEK